MSRALAIKREPVVGVSAHDERPGGHSAPIRLQREHARARIAPSRQLGSRRETAQARRLNVFDQTSQVLDRYAFRLGPSASTSWPEVIESARRQTCPAGTAGGSPVRQLWNLFRTCQPAERMDAHQCTRRLPIQVHCERESRVSWSSLTRFWLKSAPVRPYFVSLAIVSA